MCRRYAKHEDALDPPLGERIGRAMLIVLLAVAIAGALLTAFPD
jgi:hypothetical protein